MDAQRLGVVAREYGQRPLQGRKQSREGPHRDPGGCSEITPRTDGDQGRAEGITERARVIKGERRPQRIPDVRSHWAIADVLHYLCLVVCSVYEVTLLLG